MDLMLELFKGGTKVEHSSWIISEILTSDESMGQEKYGEEMILLLKHKDPEIRSRASHVLDRIKSFKAIPKLKEMLKDKAPTKDKRTVSFWADLALKNMDYHLQELEKRTDRVQPKP